VSCASAGNCSAGGYYKDSSLQTQPFVVSKVNGTWRNAIRVPVPDAPAIGQNGVGIVSSISCASAGNCSAGGFYADNSGHGHLFVVSQVNGTWRKPVLVRGIAVSGLTTKMRIVSISCASPGNCSAGGYYGYTSVDYVWHSYGFVVSQVNGTWHDAIRVPGLAALGTGEDTGVDSLSCGSAGNCSAVGNYRLKSGRGLAFVANEVNGTWHTAINIPGSAVGGSSFATSVSCASAGNCSAVGSYADGSGRGQGFVVSEVNGTWRAVTPVPGLATLAKRGHYIGSVSCASAGNCGAGGYYVDGAGGIQAFVVSKVNGTWHAAIEVPGTATLNKFGVAQVSTVSCASAGNCSAGGHYTDNVGHSQAFVVSGVNGTWHAAIEVPGTAVLNNGFGAQVNSVSCGAARNCSAGGYYSDQSQHHHAFIVSES
jgi:hypothetical protein